MDLGKYEIIDELGRGGFGSVYKARDKVLNRIVAVKVLHPNLVNDPTFMKRFRQEAQIAAQLDNPNLVPVYDFGESEGHYYIVMAYMPGGSLKDQLQENGAFSKEKTLQVFQQIASGLAYAHKRGVIHRDLKPGNILFDEEGKARVSDMGFAKLLHGDSSLSLTTSGGMIGTPSYMAPEIWRGKPATSATDIYSLACILVEMQTGETLFGGESTPEIFAKIFEPLKLPEKFPKEWRSVTTKALDKEAEKRFGEIEEFVQALSNPQAKPGKAKTSKTEPQPKGEASEGASSDESSQNGIKRQAGAKTNKALLFGGIALLAVFGIVMFLRGAGVFEKPASQTDEEIMQTARAQVQTTATFEAEQKALNVEQTKEIEQLAPIGSVQGEVETGEIQSGTIQTGQIIEPSEIPESGETKTREIDDMVMVYVPAGEFIMGSTTFDSSRPVRRVTLDAYWIDKFEVTNSQYQRCIDANSCSELFNPYGSEYYNKPNDNYPATAVNWDQAKAYCEWVGGDLPTEAQWEKAARGENGNEYPWGNDPPNYNLLNYNTSAWSGTKPVGSYPEGASPYGAMDMAGNVLEWVNDWYADNYDAGQTKNPLGPTNGTNRVIRGGYSGSSALTVRCAYRRYANPGSAYYFNGNLATEGRYWGFPDHWDGDMGFRCVSSP